MQENEFEKQVKLKMDELSFSPSLPVWEAVKKQIEKKKRRTLPFIFLLTVIAIAGSYVIYINLNNNIKKQNKIYTALNNTKEKPASTYLEQNNKKRNSRYKTTSRGIKKDTLALIKKQYHYLPKNLDGFNQKNNHFFNKSKLTVIQNAKRNHFQINQPATLPQSSIKKDFVTAASNPIIYNKRILNTDSLKQNDSNFNQTINVHADSSISSLKTNPLVINTDSISKKNSAGSDKKQVLNKNNFTKWKWGITAVYGRSNLVNNFNLSTIKSSQANDYSADTLTSRTNISGKPYKPASAYSFGITLKRQIFKNAYLNSGLKYVHLSTKSYTAISSNYSLVAVPSSFNLNSANSNYIASSKKTYTNKYNFIELPVSLENNLLHIKKFTLSSDMGVSVMQLLNGKSLIYNDRSNVFLNDTSRLQRRTQFQLLFGLSLQLNTKNSGSFLLGPHVEYSLSDFLKTNDYDKLHYMQFGLQATWLFNKK